MVDLVLVVLRRNTILSAPTFVMFWVVLVLCKYYYGFCGMKSFVFTHPNEVSNGRKPLTIIVQQDKQKETTYTVDLVLVVLRRNIHQ
jgi:hypothetical protein